MTRPSLVEQIDSIAWSEEGIILHQALMQFGPTDEGAAVVLLVAAQLIARQWPDDSLAAFLETAQLTSEFEDLVMEVRRRNTIRAAAVLPKLRVVGGTDVAL